MNFSASVKIKLFYVYNLYIQFLIFYFFFTSLFFIYFYFFYPFEAKIIHMQPVNHTAENQTKLLSTSFPTHCITGIYPQMYLFKKKHAFLVVCRSSVFVRFTSEGRTLSISILTVSWIFTKDDVSIRVRDKQKKTFCFLYIPIFSNIRTTLPTFSQFASGF